MTALRDTFGRMKRSSGPMSVVASAMVVVSSACCVGPLGVAFSLVGLSSSTVLAIENVVGPFRPFLLTGTGLFLALGFYASYFKKPPCDERALCRAPMSRTLQRTLLGLAAVLFVTLLYFTYVHPNLDVLFGIY